MSAITYEQATCGICPDCGSDMVDRDTTVLPQRAWFCIDCHSQWWEVIPKKDDTLRPTITQEEEQ